LYLGNTGAFEWALGVAPVYLITLIYPPMADNYRSYSWKETDPKYAHAFTAGWVIVALVIALFRLPTSLRHFWQNSGHIHPALALGIREQISLHKDGTSRHSIASVGRSRALVWSSVVGAWLMYVPPGFKLDVGQCE
jgi:hypothetical protein